MQLEASKMLSTNLHKIRRTHSILPSEGPFPPGTVP